MTGWVQWCDEFLGIYMMNPATGGELRDPGAMNHTADRPGLLLCALGLLRVGSHRKTPRWPILDQGTHCFPNIATKVAKSEVARLG